MRRQLNTLYVTTEGAWLRKDGANIVMDVDGETRARLPIHMLEGLVCLGRVMVSPPLMGYCAEQGITVSYLSMHGRFQARVEGPVSGNVLLRREQYRRTDDPTRCAQIVQNILVGKLHNQRAVLGRGLRDHMPTSSRTMTRRRSPTRTNAWTASWTRCKAKRLWTCCVGWKARRRRATLACLTI